MTATHTTNPAHDFVDREPAHQHHAVDGLGRQTGIGHGGVGRGVASAKETTA